MSGRIFLDTNVLLYSYSEYEPLKRSQALTAIAAGEVWISTQVLIEFVNVNYRKLKTAWPDIQTSLIELTNNYEITSTSSTTITQATRVAARYGFSWFDSLIIAAALECGCETLYSEDMHHGQLIEDTLRIVNPFR